MDWLAVSLTPQTDGSQPGSRGREAGGRPGGAVRPEDCVVLSCPVLFVER